MASSPAPEAYDPLLASVAFTALRLGDSALSFAGASGACWVSSFTGGVVFDGMKSMATSPPASLRQATRERQTPVPRRLCTRAPVAHWRFPAAWAVRSAPPAPAARLVRHRPRARRRVLR